MVGWAPGGNQRSKVGGGKGGRDKDDLGGKMLVFSGKRLYVHTRDELACIGE
jgi:hypothetical protein